MAAKRSKANASPPASSATLAGSGEDAPVELALQRVRLALELELVLVEMERRLEKREDLAWMNLEGAEREEPEVDRAPPVAAGPLPGAFSTVAATPRSISPSSGS
uniref:Uncharacterized protein n=1 Tax=Kalanchoe fedtschenkoi TaxID=63787 RepID=A0A7N0T2W9_KALFE